jgi:hypothetical protein
MANHSERSRDVIKKEYLNPTKFYSHAVSATGGKVVYVSVGVDCLVHPDLLLEVEVVAVVG